MEFDELARAQTPHGELVLRARRADSGPGTEPVIELRANGLFVMDTAETTSERALARAGLAQVTTPTSVLVGGLGLGFTAIEVLADPRVASCVVVEIEPQVVEWLRTGVVPHGRGLLADDRLTVVVADVADTITAAPDASYDVIVLDVDNGPANLVHTTNAGLYTEQFVAQLRRVLTPGGTLVIWSADPAPDLLARLDRHLGPAGAEEHQVTLGQRAESYWLVFARRAD